MEGAQLDCPDMSTSRAQKIKDIVDVSWVACGTSVEALFGCVQDQAGSLDSDGAGLIEDLAACSEEGPLSQYTAVEDFSIDLIS